ncbi:pentapeptide repeat-containing protein [Okeania sp. SIO1I7]|uniref:pentapeptide repeat-containing protein n=1 Tax=Okeania sp. SIO1I7 TaxID=2607772 RepID=UPI0013FAB568|nr:pentapeptide repeat-containing protein [Okeania sp. SIO1I7]NET25881.1 pentapeptide repeat-containing protein [Okeania sp. SIO1I7]
MMKARKILQEYKKGRRDFQGVSLRGLSFKRKNLSGADFSGADIRGTNFRRANLTGAKFCGATAGLQKRWVIVLLVGIFTLAGISGFLTLFNSYFVSKIFNSNSLENQIVGWVSLILVVVFWIIIIRNGISNVGIGIAVAGAFALVGVFAIATVLSTALGENVAGDIALAIALATAFTGAFTLAIAIAGAFALVIAIAGAIAGAITGAITGAIAFAGAIIGTFAEAVAIAVAIAVVQILLSAYIAYWAIKGNEKYALIRGVTITFAAIGGTSFRNADLIDTDFTNATLKSTDFRGADITRTCWKNTVKLDRIRPGETYLKSAKVRELIRTGEGQEQNFDRLELKGINLKEANLQGASFFGTDLNRANLQNANLSGAKLVQTLLEGADLTGATLTGACVEDWAISNTTKLTDINCDYIFLKYPQRERRPADPEKYFEPGEFAKLAQKIPNTVDLIFKDGIDWQIFQKTFQELRVESETEELPVIQTIENKGDGAFVIRVKVSDKIDEAEYERKFWQKYKPKLKAKNKEIKLLNQQIEHIRKENTELIGVVKTMAEKENTKYEFNNPKFGGGFAGRDQKFEGGFAGRDQISGNQYNYSTNPETKQNLAEAAQEIQELLKQLEQSNPTETTASQMKVAAQAIEILESNPPLKQRVIGVLKSAGTEAFKEAIDNPVANVLVAAFQGWIEP